MAEQRICDCCGKPGARETIVGYVVVGEVIEGRPTGTSFGADLCDACRDGECDKLLAKARDQQKRHAPIHKKIIAIKDDLAALLQEKDKAVRARDEIEEQNTRALPATRDAPALRQWASQDARQQHEKLSVTVNDMMSEIAAKHRRIAELNESARS